MKKKYVPCCPTGCSGGEYALYEVKDPLQIKLTPKELSKAPIDSKLFHCRHCGFVWFQLIHEPLGLDGEAVGFYDTIDHPDQFVPVPKDYRLPHAAYRWYWRTK